MKLETHGIKKLNDAQIVLKPLTVFLYEGRSQGQLDEVVSAIYSVAKHLSCAHDALSSVHPIGDMLSVPEHVLTARAPVSVTRSEVSLSAPWSIELEHMAGGHVDVTIDPEDLVAGAGARVLVQRSDSWMGLAQTFDANGTQIGRLVLGVKQIETPGYFAAVQLLRAKFRSVTGFPHGFLRPTAPRAGQLDLLDHASQIWAEPGKFHRYLGCYAAPGDYVFLHLPEGGLHPQQQIALAEIIGMLVSRQIWVMLITHSPYLIDHLSNLMAAHALTVDARERMRQRLSFGSDEAFLNPADVSAYLFRPCGDSVQVDDIRETDSIDCRTFARETEWLADLFLEIKAR